MLAKKFPRKEMEKKRLKTSHDNRTQVGRHLRLNVKLVLNEELQPSVKIL